MVLFLSQAASAFESLKKKTKIEKDEHGGYTDTQKDYHKRMSKQSQSTRKGAYYNGKYHIKGKNFKQGEYQFIRSSGAPKEAKKKKEEKK